MTAQPALNEKTAKPAAKRPLPPAYRLSQAPQIDYEAHPGYGDLPAPSLGDTIKSLARFMPYLGYVWVKKLLDYENLPLLTKRLQGGDAPQGNFALRFAKMLIKTKSNRLGQTLRGKRKPPQLEEGSKELVLREQIKENGFVCTDFTDDQLNGLRAVTADLFAMLRKKREDKGDALSHDDDFLWLDRGAHPMPYEYVHEMFEQSGLLKMASSYLKRPAGIKQVMMQLNDTKDTFWKEQFADIKLKDPKTTYFHLDTTYGMLKCMIYLNEIGPQNGPFCYVRGSNKANIGYLEGLIRRANDYCGFSSKKPEARRKFMALPKMFRKKCDIGADILDDSKSSQALMDSQFSFTSEYGDAIIFDGIGIHRGGMVKEGERVVVTVLLAEI